MAVSRAALTLLAPLVCGGCTGWQSALDPHAAQAASLKTLLWIFTIVCLLVWSSVMLVLWAATLRTRSGRGRGQTRAVDANVEKRIGRVVGAAVVTTALIVSALTLISFFMTHRLSAAGDDPLTVRVRGYQWWWEITYVDERPDRIFTTANEIHIPVGQPIRFELSAADVIHSFWVPNLAGKQDLIPGRDNTLTVTAQQPGLYRGQCAEFCGLQHAHMALLVIVETPRAFEQWRQSQLASAASPADPQQLLGQKLFTSKPCASCHTIEGSPAAANIGPDLTHVASRRFIAAGLLPTTRGSLAAWIADPQTLKPGSNMPAVPLSAAELNAIVAYVAALK